MLRRVLVLAYGCLSYALFLVTFLYACAFVGNLGVPTSLDGEAQMTLPRALGIDLLLLTVFAVQHSGMARPAFKRLVKRHLPEAMERSTYVLMSSLALLLLFWQWQPLGVVVWSIEAPLGRALAYALFATGWLIVLVTTFLINHFDLFGLRQVWLYFRGIAYTPLRFTMPGPYKLVRHPLYVGWLIAFWATPTMTLAHLVFALGTTAYILGAIVLEERDLVAAHPEYEAYRRQVPMLLPRLPALGQGSSNGFAPIRVR